MKLIRAIGMNGSYAAFEISGGDNSESIGDQAWFSKCGTLLEIHECVDSDVLRDISNLFDKPKSVLGAFRRMTE